MLAIDPTPTFKSRLVAMATAVPKEFVANVTDVTPGSAITQPIVAGGPGWFSVKNMLIGGGLASVAYLVYAMLLPPKKKKSAPVSGRRRR